MPEEILTADPVADLSAPPAAATEAPAERPPQPGTPTPDAPKGSQSLVDEVDAMMSPAKPEPTKKAPAKKEPAKAEPEEKPAADTKSAEAAKADKGKEKDPVALRKRLEEIKEKYSGLEQTTTNEKKELREKIAAFESRKWLTPEQEQQQVRLEKELKTLQAEFYARNYQESPDFKSKYEPKWQGQYAKAKREVESMTVVLEDVDGEQKTRQAGEADLKRVIGLKDNVVAQQDLAEQLFGKYSNLVLSHVNRLGEIEEEANEELRQKRLSYDKEVAERQDNDKKISERFNRAHSEVEAGLTSKHPEYFGRSDDEGSNTAMQKGIEFVDKTLEQADTLPVEDRAARTAIIRRWAGAFPRMVHLLTQARAEAEEARRQVAELRGTDPGAGGDAPSPGNAVEESKGTEDLIKEFEKMDR